MALRRTLREMENAMAEWVDARMRDPDGAAVDRTRSGHDRGRRRPLRVAAAAAASGTVSAPLMAWPAAFAAALGEHTGGDSTN